MPGRLARERQLLHPLRVRSCEHPGISDNDRLYTDADGVRCLDYINAMMLLADERHGDARAWAQDRLAEIENKSSP